MVQFITAAVTAVWFTFLAAGAAWAGDPANISVKEAFERADKGELAAGRHPQAEGVARVRHPGEQHRDNHAPEPGRLSQGDPGCCRQGRQAGRLHLCGGRAFALWLQLMLERAGIKNTINVLGGMFGTRRDIGWLKAGLPVKSWQGREK